MQALISLAGVFFIIYGMSIFFIILFKNCSFAEARQTLSSFFNENATYDLASDINFNRDINQIVCDVLGQERYQNLCTLAKHHPALYFEKYGSGLACVNVVLSTSDANEQLQLESLINSRVKFYLINYKLKDIVTYVEWEKSEIFGFPLLRITFPRNDDDVERIKALRNLKIKNIIASSGDVYDDSEDLLT